MDDDEIRKWVEDHAGKPTTVEKAARGGAAAAMLLIDFPSGASKPPLDPITWDEFFTKIDWLLPTRRRRQSLSANSSAAIASTS